MQHAAGENLNLIFVLSVFPTSNPFMCVSSLHQIELQMHMYTPLHPICLDDTPTTICTYTM